jgi:hypothetical protein
MRDTSETQLVRGGKPLEIMNSCLSRNVYHLRCAGFEDEAGKHLKNDGLHWFCAQCNLGANKLFEVIINMQLRQDENNGKGTKSSKS